MSPDAADGYSASLSRRGGYVRRDRRADFGEAAGPPGDNTHGPLPECLSGPRSKTSCAGGCARTPGSHAPGARPGSGGRQAGRWPLLIPPQRAFRVGRRILVYESVQILLGSVRSAQQSVLGGRKRPQYPSAIGGGVCIVVGRGADSIFGYCAGQLVRIVCRRIVRMEIVRASSVRLGQRAPRVLRF